MSVNNIRVTNRHRYSKREQHCYY